MATVHTVEKTYCGYGLFIGQAGTFAQYFHVTTALGKDFHPVARAFRMKRMQTRAARCRTVVGAVVDKERFFGIYARFLHGTQENRLIGLGKAHFVGKEYAVEVIIHRMSGTGKKVFDRVVPVYLVGVA